MREKGRWSLAKGLLVGLAGLGLLTGAAWLILFGVHEFALSIELEGAPYMTVEYGESYRDPGARVRLTGPLFPQEGLEIPGIKVESSALEKKVLGEQQITYQASFGPWQTRAKRTVRIVDTKCPVIILNEDDTTTIEPGTAYQEPGYTAVDNFDGDITSRVRRWEEYGKVIYSVVDSSGNPAVVEREIPYYDGSPPEIFLRGGKRYGIVCGSPYVEPGFLALDNVDGDLTEQVSVEGEVIWWMPGVYPVVYTVRDSYDNETTLTREVKVSAADWVQSQWPQEKTIYLTFDDGPGPYTMSLLDTLDRFGVKATFFVTNSGYDEVMEQIVARGHSIGVHTVSHDYQNIYSSPEAYFDDLLGMRQIIFENTGVETCLMRFPGGSSNEVSRRCCQGIMTTLSQAVRDAGFQYFDWNVDSQDAGGAKTAEEVYENVVGGVSKVRVAVVLQHDIHPYSVEAVEKIIRWGKNNGYRFESLNVSSPAFHHNIRN